MTQRVQLAIQNRVIRRALTNTDRFSPPFAIRLLALIPFLRRIPARMIGLGVEAGTCAYVRHKDYACIRKAASHYYR